MTIRQFGGFASAGRALDESLFYQERFVNILDGARILPHRRRDGVESDGTALELLYDGRNYAVVHTVQTPRIDVQCRESYSGDFDIDIDRKSVV